MESVFQLECRAVFLTWTQSIFTVQSPSGPPWSSDGGTLVKCGNTQLPQKTHHEAWLGLGKHLHQHLLCNDCLRWENMA